MILRHVRKLVLFPVLCLVSAALPVEGQQLLTDDGTVLSTARQKYYNLKDAGLIEFKANIRPNWEVVLGELAGNNRALLNGLKFSCSVDPEGKLHFTHTAEVLPRDQASADKIAGI